MFVSVQTVIEKKKKKKNSEVKQRSFTRMSLRFQLVFVSDEQQMYSLCLSSFRGRRYRHPEVWSSSLLSFIKQESGLTVCL